MAYCQPGSNRQLGIRGQVLDSLTNQPVIAATVSVYHKKAGKILQYGFTNNTGSFALSNLPLRDSLLQIRISHIGYEKAEMDLKVVCGQSEADMAKVFLKKRSRRIEEVLVNRPPMLMNRDTLEINPEAFDLQPNAVVEDLLTKVPGIVVWGDGKITVNGKNVAKVLVEGRPFFGRDPTVATRNIPSDAIDKVKVYESPQNTAYQEQQLEIDITLKNEKKRGLFGKISYSEGTKDHREGTFLVNAFSPKNQLSLFAGGNNTNKIVRNVGDFLAANVYKPGGERLEPNTPMFGQSGLNRYVIGGTKFERNWNERFNTDIQFLLNDRRSENVTEIQEMRLLEDGQKQYIAEKQQRSNDGSGQSYLGLARYRNSKWDLRINSEAGQTASSEENRHERYVTDKEEEALSTLNKSVYDDENRRNGRLGFNLRQTDSVVSKLEVNYKFETQRNELGRRENILFNGRNPLSRIKQTDQNSSRHELDTDVGLNKLFRNLFGWPAGLQLEMNNNLVFRQADETQSDQFLDTIKNTYTVKNEALSYTDRLKEVFWTPQLSVSKGFVRPTGQGRNSLFAMTALGMQTFIRKNVSSHELRIVDQHFLYALPTAMLRYERAQQLSNKAFTFTFRSLLKQPEIYQLTALMDTTQKDYNRIGNHGLRPEEQYQFSLEFTDLRYARNMSQRLRLTYSLKRNVLAENITYRTDGGILTQTVNTDGLPALQGDYQYRTGKKVWNRALNLELTSRFSSGQYYFFSDGARYKSLLTDAWLETRAQYGLLERLNIGVLGAFSSNWNHTGNDAVRAGSHSLGLDVVLTWPRRTTLISRFVSKNFYAGGLSSNQQYLWNIELYYRMLKKEQLEIKISGYDILRNNRTVRTVLRDNIVRQVSVNNIQQFFLFSLSYYPRIF